jgi:hypothetical protein
VLRNIQQNEDITFQYFRIAFKFVSIGAYLTRNTTYIQTCIHSHIHSQYIHTYTYIYIPTYTHKYVHTYTHIHTNTYIIHTHTHTYLHTHTYIHAYIHTYIHTRAIQDTTHNNTVPVCSTTNQCISHISLVPALFGVERSVSGFEIFCSLLFSCLLYFLCSSYFFLLFRLSINFSLPLSVLFFLFSCPYFPSLYWSLISFSFLPFMPLLSIFHFLSPRV